MSETRGHCNEFISSFSITYDDDDMKLRLQQHLSISNSRDHENNFDLNYPCSKEDRETIDISTIHTDSEDDDENQLEGVKDVMPAEFYQNFESFLNEDPPKLRRSKSAALSSATTSFSTSNTKKNWLGQMQKSGIKSTTGENSRWENFAKIIVVTSNKANSPSLFPFIEVDFRLTLIYTCLGKYSSDSVCSNAGPRRASIDENLLRDAFAYTDHILRVAVLEERKELEKAAGLGGRARTDSRFKVAQKKSIGHDSDIEGGYSNIYIPFAEKKGNGSSISGVVQKLRSKTQSLTPMSKSHTAANMLYNREQIRRSSSSSSSSHADFNISAAGLEVEADKKCFFDMESLVSNFENGITLQRLKMELAASKESMLLSSVAIQNISNCYLGGDLSGGLRDWSLSDSLSQRKSDDIRI